jgi:hypothetical protein
MTDSTALERSYRRMLACYPRSFRRDNEDEILAVLMATAEDGQTRIGLAEAADLIRGAVRMRLWPAAARPAPVRAAVRLMLAGAAAELAFVFTVLLTSGTVKAAVLARYPGAWSGAQIHLAVDVATAPVIIGLWLWLAWANGRGQDWARMVSVACFGLMTLGMLGALAQDAVTFAPADMIAAATEWALGLAAVVLIFTPAASRYCRPAVTAATQ